MKPRLNKILQETLKYFNMSHEDWELLKFTRTAKIAQIMQLFSYIAADCRYRPSTIAKFLGRDRTTVVHNISRTTELASVYKDVRVAIRSIMDALHYEGTHTSTGYLARSRNGLLTLSSTLPEREAGYWLAADTKPFVNQHAFPQITWDSHPVKVTIKVCIE